MPTVRHVIVCEGYSERAYIQGLQAFLDKLPAAPDVWSVPLKFFTKDEYVAGNGHYVQLEKHFLKAKKENRNTKISIWADFDLYHRDVDGCSRLYINKGQSLPDFYFSFHNFEDFLALHLDEEDFQSWLRFGSAGHFESPCRSEACLEWARKIIKGYQKGSIPPGFVSESSLRNLKANLARQPRSNPYGLQGIGFAEFIVGEIDRFHPDVLK